MSDSVPVLMGVFLDELRTRLVVELANAPAALKVPGKTLQQRCREVVYSCIEAVHAIAKEEGEL